MSTAFNITYKSDMDVELVDSMGTDLSIARSAWVSTKPKLEIDPPPERVKGLINFLMRDRHGTPFEHNSITFRISAPLFVFYEFHRHRAGWSYNEESARYRELEPVFYMPRADRALRQTGKPGAYTFEPGNYSERAIAYGAHRRVAQNAWGEYQNLLQTGIAREVARNVLPVSIYKTMYATCNLRSLFSFLSLRWSHPMSQVPTFPLDEIQMVAQSLDELAREKFPIAFDCFDKQGRVAP